MTNTAALGALGARLTDGRAAIGVAGLGYVGLPLAVELARAGFSVTDIAPDTERVRSAGRDENHVEWLVTHARLVFDTRERHARRQSGSDQGRPALTGARARVRALVTGGAGFIGSHLTEALLAAGREVVVLDDLSTGQLGNLAGVAGHPRLEVVAGSVTDETLVRKLVTGADLVYHLAAAVGVRLILDRPVATIETNIMGTETILRAALEGRPRVVLASTSEVYGKNDRVPLSEDDDRLLGPTTKSRWSYACSKAIDEFLGLAYHREHGLPVTIVRFFNTIGPRQTGRYGMVVPRFVRQALDGGPITVYGDGCQSRCFTDVEDTVRATIALSLAPAAVGEVFNVGTTHELTIRTLAERVRALAGSDSPIVLVPYEEAYQPGFEDLHRRVPDIRKAERVVGYRPRVPLDETLQRVIGHLRSTGRS